jgi:drug/metabolite transporter (DMT)-like permease
VSSSEASKSDWLTSYIALGLVWGCSFLFIKQGLTFLTPFGVAFGRCALGALTLFLYAHFKGIDIPRDPKIWLKLWCVSLLLNSIPGVLFALAQTKVTSILAGIINATTPLMTLVVMLTLFREEKISKNQILGLAVGAIGIATVFGIWNGFGTNPVWAVCALLVAVLCYGISFPFTKKFVIPIQLAPETMAAMQLIAGSATLLPFYLLDGIANDNYSLIPILSMLALGIFGSGFAYIWNFKVIKAAGSAIASTVTYITPLVAVAMGLIFLRENVTWNEPVGGLIVLFGAAISQNRLKFIK